MILIFVSPLPLVMTMIAAEPVSYPETVDNLPWLSLSESYLNTGLDPSLARKDLDSLHDIILMAK